MRFHLLDSSLLSKTNVSWLNFETYGAGRARARYVYSEDFAIHIQSASLASRAKLRFLKICRPMNENEQDLALRCLAPYRLSQIGEIHPDIDKHVTMVAI